MIENTTSLSLGGITYFRVVEVGFYGILDLGLYSTIQKKNIFAFLCWLYLISQNRHGEFMFFFCIGCSINIVDPPHKCFRIESAHKETRHQHLLLGKVEVNTHNIL